MIPQTNASSPTGMAHLSTQLARAIHTCFGLRQTKALSAALCLLAVTELPAASYYCDPASGSMSNPGTAALPWSTLQAVFAANKTFAAGDVIYLRSGYHGAPQVRGLNSDFVTIQPDTGATPTAKSLSTYMASKWIVSGLTVSPEFGGTLFTGNYVTLDQTSSYITVQNCLIYSAASITGWTAADWKSHAGTGIFSYAPNTVLKNNTVMNVGFGIQIGKSNVNTSFEAVNSLVSGNWIHDFCYDGMRGLANNCVYEYNTIERNYAVDPNNHNDGFQSWSIGSDGVVGHGTLSNVILRGNKIIAVSDPNQPFPGSMQGMGNFSGLYDGWIIENNLVITNGQYHGITLYGATNCRIVNNTVVKSAIDPSVVTPWIGIFAQKIDNGPYSGMASTNNIVRNNVSTALNLSGTYTADHNTTVTTDYAAYFADYVGFDFHLKAGSPAVDVGDTALAPATDLDQNARIAPYDRGCYELVSVVPAVPQAPSGLVATGGNAQVTLGWNAAAGAASYNVKRSVVSGGPYTTIASPATTAYTDTGLTNGTTYYYVVSAVGTGGESANSAAASATPQIPQTIPVANAGPNQTILTQTAPASVTLNGSASADADGDTLTYVWSGVFGTATGVSPTVNLPVGIHTITLTVDDGHNHQSSANVLVAVTLGSDLATTTALNATIDQLTATNQSLQAQLTAANAQIAQLTTANQTLTTQLSQASAQITTLTAQNAQLTSEASAVAVQLQALTQLLAGAFNDPNFQIPGSTLSQQLQSLVNAINQLNHGQQQALYKNLGG